MAMQQEERRLSIPLGDGVFVDVLVQTKLSGPVVPKPRPRRIADLVLRAGDPASGEPMALELNVQIDLDQRLE